MLELLKLKVETALRSQEIRKAVAETNKSDRSFSGDYAQGTLDGRIAESTNTINELTSILEYIEKQLQTEKEGK